MRIPLPLVETTYIQHCSASDCRLVVARPVGMLAAIASKLIKPVNTTMLRSTMQSSLASFCGLRHAQTALLSLVVPSPLQLPCVQQRAVTAYAQQGRRTLKTTSVAPLPPAAPSPDARVPPPVAATAASQPVAAQAEYTTAKLRTIPSLGKVAEAALVDEGIKNAGDLQRFFVDSAQGNTAVIKDFLKDIGVTHNAQIIEWLVRVCPEAASTAHKQQGTSLRSVSGLGKKSLLLLQARDINSTEKLLEEFSKHAAGDLNKMRDLLKSYGISHNQEILEWLAGERGMPLSDAQDARRSPLRSLPGLGKKGALALTAAGITTPDELKACYVNVAGGNPDTMKEHLKSKFGILQPSTVVAWLEGQFQK